MVKKRICLAMVAFLTLLILGSCGTKETSTSAETQTLISNPSEVPQILKPDYQNIENTSEPIPTAEGNTMEEKPEMTGFSLTMLDVGQGLGLVIQADGYTMVYDGGPAPDEETDGESYQLLTWLENNNIEHIDLMIASHYDTDHISGLVEAMKCETVGTILCGNYDDGTQICERFHQQLKNMEAEIIHPQVGETYELGNLQIEILSPKNYEYEVENDRSIAVRLTYGNFHCVITGDAEQTAEADMLNQTENLSAALYVCGHHGSATSSTKAFVEAISPSYAFISCGKGNEYGQPSVETLQTLKEANVEIFRTDTQEDVTCYSDGKTIWFDQNPTDNWEPGSSEPNVSADIDLEGYKYILNTYRHKIHLPECDSVNNISPENITGTNESLEELINEGYEPCKRCLG